MLFEKTGSWHCFVASFTTSASTSNPPEDTHQVTAPIQFSIVPRRDQRHLQQQQQRSLSDLALRRFPRLSAAAANANNSSDFLSSGSGGLRSEAPLIGLGIGLPSSSASASSSPRLTSSLLAPSSDEYGSPPHPEALLLSLTEADIDQRPIAAGFRASLGSVRKTPPPSPTGSSSSSGTIATGSSQAPTRNKRKIRAGLSSPETFKPAKAARSGLPISSSVADNSAMNFSNSTAQHQEQQLQRGALSFPPVNHQQRPVNHQNSPHNTMQQQFQQQHVPLPQQQQQHQQQHQQGQQNGGGQPGSAGGAAAAAAAAAAPQMSLAGVLHYLQSEWRRWERDRNEWEIERAEMRARIALLEGERRSAENLKSDMMRRVKMLEFALRQER